MNSLQSTLAACAGLAVGELGAATSPAADPPLEATRACDGGARHAIIAGRHECLKAGRRCSKRHDRQYHRCGFHCHSGRLTSRLTTIRTFGTLCFLGTLAKGASGTVIVTVLPHVAGRLLVGARVGIAFSAVSSQPPDPDPANNVVDEITTVEAPSP